jgi:uncharacterized protein
MAEINRQNDSGESSRLHHAQYSPEQSHSPAQLKLSTPNKIFLGPNGLRPGWRLFLYFAMAFLVFFGLAGLGHLVFRHWISGLWRGFYIQFALAAAALVPGFVMAAVEGRSFGNFGLPGREAFGKFFWLGLAWGFATLSLLMLLMRGFGVFSFGHLALHGGRILRFAGFWGAFFLLVGFFEEFTFRGYTQFTLANAVRFWPAAVLLSLIFGALHLANPGEAWMGALAAALIGLFFCFTLYRTGSLWFAVGMHASWDWGESFLYSVPDSGEISRGHLLSSSFHGPRWLTGGSVGPEGSVLLFVVIAAAWVVFHRVYPKSRWPARCSHEDSSESLSPVDAS